MPFRFGYDSVSGKYGYILPDGEGGADSLHFFSGSLKVEFRPRGTVWNSSSPNDRRIGGEIKITFNGEVIFEQYVYQNFSSVPAGSESVGSWITVYDNN